jgi:hypothetical protein
VDAGGGVSVAFGAQGLKPRLFMPGTAALKRCPDTKQSKFKNRSKYNVKKIKRLGTRLDRSWSGRNELENVEHAWCFAK